MVLFRIPHRIALACVAVAVSAAAAQDGSPSVQVLEAYTAPTAPKQSSAEVYARFVNVETTDQLIGADSEFSRRVDLVGADGKKRPYEEFQFQEDVEIGFREGAPHLQLVGLKRPLKSGESLVVKLHFAESGSLILNVTVR